MFLLDSSNYGIHLGSRILGPLFVAIWLHFYREQNRYVITLWLEIQSTIFTEDVYGRTILICAVVLREIALYYTFCEQPSLASWQWFLPFLELQHQPYWLWFLCKSNYLGCAPSFSLITIFSMKQQWKWVTYSRCVLMCW